MWWSFYWQFWLFKHFWFGYGGRVLVGGFNFEIKTGFRRSVSGPFRTNSRSVSSWRELWRRHTGRRSWFGNGRTFCVYWKCVVLSDLHSTISFLLVGVWALVWLQKASVYCFNVPHLLYIKPHVLIFSFWSSISLSIALFANHMLNLIVFKIGL